MIPRRYLPSIPSLLALEALERLGTASAVAEELALTQGAVSKQLKVLEGQLGVALITREAQRLTLTPAGRDFVAEVRKALKIVTDASLALRANPRGGTLNLAILPAFGMHWLAPRLARFAQKHPEVTVNLSTRLRPFDFAPTSFDAAIHYGRQDWPGAAFLKLMEEEVQAVASPDLVALPLADAHSVLSYPLLHLESRTGDWGRWLAQAAVHGMGVALLPTFLIGAELASGRLVPVFGAPVRAYGAYYLVWPEARAPRAPLASFRAFLADEARSPGGAAAG